MTVVDVLYRYQETHYAPPADEMGDPGRGEGSVEVSLHEYPVVRRTPRGCWIDLGYGDERFVLTSARKQFACPTEAAARESFMARKRAQIRIYRACIARTECALSAFDRLITRSAA